MDVRSADVGWVAPQTHGPATSVDISFWTAVKIGAGMVVGGALVSIALWVALAVLIMIGLSLPATP